METHNELDGLQNRTLSEARYSYKSFLICIHSKFSRIEINDEAKNSYTELEDDFQSLVIDPEPHYFDDGDVRIIKKVQKKVKMRYCQPGDYNEFSELIKEEGLCISSPIIQFEDFDNLLSAYCKKIQIRHNVYMWKKYRKRRLRCDLRDAMAKDYVCRLPDDRR